MGVDPSIDPDALRRAREAAGLTQHQLARLIDVAGGERVSQWERGAAAPRSGTLARIAQALQVSVQDLLVGQGEPDLRSLRTAAGLTTTELAERAQISVATLNRWQAGRFSRVPKPATLQHLATALGCDVDEVRRAMRHT
jgi:transcriptional regulator with XRE-family HTH domain